MSTGIELRLVLALLVCVQALTSLGGIVAIDRVLAVDPATAERVGETARWALALLAIVGFGLTATGLVRLRSKLLAPLRELEVVLTAYRVGERLRRCAHYPNTPLADALVTVNGLLDAASLGAGATERERGEAHRDRVALVGVLDRSGEPLVVWDPGEGRLVAASSAAHDLIAGEGDPLEDVRSGKGEPIERFEVESGPLHLYRL